MFALDLFNNDHERRLAEGAVDQLEQRRIDDLAMKMDDLVARAKTAKTAEAKQALMKEFQKCKAERDSYYMVRNETMGYGSLGETGLPDVADKAAKMARLNQPGKGGSDAVTPQQRINPNPNKGIVGHAVDWLRGKGGPGKEGPTYEDLDEGAEDSKISIARYVYAQIMNALESNAQFATIQWPQGTMQGPKQDATLSRNQMHFLIQRLVSMSREQRKQFTHQVLTDRVATLQWLTNKKIKPAPTPQQPVVDPAQGSLPLGKPVGEARSQKKKSNNDSELNSSSVRDTKLSRELTKARAAYPNASSDIEALLRQELDTGERIKQDVDAVQSINTAQDQTITQLQKVNQQQTAQIVGLEKQLSTVAQQAQQPARVAPARVAPAPQTTPTTQATTAKSADIPIATDIPEPITPRDQEIYNKVQSLEKELKDKIDAMASWNAVAQKDPQSNNELEALRKEVERTRTELQRQVKKLTKQVKKHANSLPATDQAPVKDMGTVRRVAPTPELGQTPTDAGELGRQIGQRAQANKQAKYGKKPTAATPTDLDSLDYLDIIDASDYLSGLRKRGRGATTVEPRQAELQIEEGTAEQFGQAVRQADLTGRELERDPEWRRLQQQKKQREKNKLRSQAGYGNDADEFGDIIDMNETVKKLQQGDPITVTAPNEFEGATGEIYDFSPSRTFVIVDLYNHGKHSMHLSDVEYNQYAADQDDDEDDWYDDEELDEGAMSELDIERQDLDRMTDQQFLKAYGISKEFWKYKNQALLKKPRRRPMSAQLARSPVGQKMNTMYGSNCPGCGRSTNPDRCICESVVNPQFIIAQVTKILAGEARRMTNAPMAQLLAPVMKEYSLTLPQIDSMIPGGLKRAAGEYGIMMKEGWSDAMVARRTGRPRTPYSVYINGKKWKDFENDDHARAVMDKLKAKFKADGRDPSVITIAPTDMSEDLATPPPEAPRPAIIAPAPAAKYMVKKPQAPRAQADDPAPRHAKGSIYSDDETTLKVYKPEQYREAANPAQQAAIAIAMKKAGKKPENVDETTAFLTHGPSLSYGDQAQHATLGPVQIEKTMTDGSVVVYCERDGKRYRTHSSALKPTVAETVTDVKAGMAKIYHKLAPKIKRHRDSFLAGQLYDELENYAELHGAEAEFKRIMIGARNRAHMDYDTNPGGFQNWFWYLPFDDEVNEGLMKDPTNRKEYLDQRDKLFRMMSLESNPANKQIIRQAIKELEARYGKIKDPIREEYSTSSEAVEIAIIRRILVAHVDLIMEFGLDKVTQAIEEIAYNVGDVDEIGTSDVSAYVNQVKQILGA